MTHYDIAVIGKGLMGCGVIRHLTLTHPELNVCVIGPDEPGHRKTHQGVFASHYDQGRITRLIDPSPIWAHLAYKSVARYPLIEAESGIQFHHKVGCLRASDMIDRIQTIDELLQELLPVYDRLTAEGCLDRYPFLSFSEEFIAWDEAGDAGYINPRSLVQAQLAVAKAHGADIISEIVESVERQDDHFLIQTRDGQQLQAHKVLITTGGYTNTLLNQKLALKTRSHTILLAEVPSEEVRRLATMPSIIAGFEHPAVKSLYMLPPIEYPDGKFYIKLGASGNAEELLPAEEHTLDAVQDDHALLEWFHTDGREDIADILKTALHRMIPDLRTLSYQSVPCLLTDTEHGNPYIDQLDSGLYITTGGNGSAAKSSDEIGRLGALLTATDRWDSPLERDAFRAVFL